MALRSWVRLFVEFLTTKHGLAAAMTSDDGEFGALHAYFFDRLVPAGREILDVGVAAGELRSDVPAVLLLRAVGNLCITSRFDQANETQTMVDVFLDGLTVTELPRS